MNSLRRLYIFAILLVFTACQSAPLATSPQPTQPPRQATAPPEILVTQTPLPPTQPTGEALADVILDYSPLAQNVTVETVAEVPAGENNFWTMVMPQYRLLTLQGYLPANQTFKPQIFVYPAGDLASANENAGKMHTDLQALLQTQQVRNTLPFLPLVNALQVMHTQMQYLDFKNGEGVRFLTQFNQGLVPINNTDMIYTFQGLTSDGKYYIAVILPVTSPELPAGPEISEGFAKKLTDEPDYYMKYLSETVTLLNQQPNGSFTPDLDILDALIQSIEVK